MGIQIDPTEANAPIGPVVVYGEISELLIARPRDHSVDELGTESSVADLPLDVIRSLLRKMNLADVKRHPTVDGRRARKQDSAVLVAVARKQVAHEDFEVITGNPKPARVRHGIFSRKSRILRIFAVTFCRPFCAAPLRRETCIAGRFSNR